MRLRLRIEHQTNRGSIFTLTSLLAQLERRLCKVVDALTTTKANLINPQERVLMVPRLTTIVFLKIVWYGNEFTCTTDFHRTVPVGTLSNSSISMPTYILTYY